MKMKNMKMENSMSYLEVVKYLLIESDLPMSAKQIVKDGISFIKVESKQTGKRQILNNFKKAIWEFNGKGVDTNKFLKVSKGSFGDVYSIMPEDKKRFKDNQTKQVKQNSIESVERGEAEKIIEKDWCYRTKRRSEGFDKLKDRLNDIIKITKFHKDHSQSFYDDPLNHHPDNFQLLPERVNTSKNSNSWVRYSYEKQKQIIFEVYDVDKSANCNNPKYGNNDEEIKNIVEMLFYIY